MALIPLVTFVKVVPDVKRFWRHVVELGDQPLTAYISTPLLSGLFLLGTMFNTQSSIIKLVGFKVILP